MDEALSYVINQAKMLNLINCIKIGVNEVEISHLKFTDDTLIFVPQDTNSLLNYKRLLKYFGMMSSLQVNFDKSIIVTWEN